MLLQARFVSGFAAATLTLVVLTLVLPNLSESNEPDEKSKILDADQRGFELMNGMYEMVSWSDGDKLHRPPTVSGRWVFMDGKVMCIIHNSTNPEKASSFVGWGYGKFENGKFTYAYPEARTIEGNASSSSVKTGGVFEGEREYHVEFKGERMVMTTESGKQVWEVSPSGMVYTDQEWGPEKVYAQRRWKRITQ